MFRIGEFSKIARVSGRLLRYYDEIGLLSPQSIDPETGYRYYSAWQLPRLNRILVLKELGLSLEHIARLLDQETSVDEMRGMLTLRKAQIEQSVQQEMEQLRVVESRLQQIEQHGLMQEPDVILKAVPATPFLGLREFRPWWDATALDLSPSSSIPPCMIPKHSMSKSATCSPRKVHNRSNSPRNVCSLCAHCQQLRPWQHLHTSGGSATATGVMEHWRLGLNTMGGS